MWSVSRALSFVQSEGMLNTSIRTRLAVTIEGVIVVVRSGAAAVVGVDVINRRNQRGGRRRLPCHAAPFLGGVVGDPCGVLVMPEAREA